MDDAKGKVDFPAIGMSVSMQYAAGRQVVFQMHFPMDVKLEGISSMLERFNAAADREEAFYAQEQARRQLEVENKAVVNMQRRLNEVDAAKQEDPRKRNASITEREVKERRQVLDTLEEGKRRVAECEAFLAELIRKAGRDGAHSSPDN